MGTVTTQNVELSLSQRLGLSTEEIAEFCRRWQISEFALFGSILRDDFRPESDVDVLIGYEPAANWSLFDHIRMEQELSELVRREVDVLTRHAVEESPNWIRRREILGTAQTIYVAR